MVRVAPLRLRSVIPSRGAYVPQMYIESCTERQCVRTNHDLDVPIRDPLKLRRVERI